jgi:hypothetical protein
MTLSRQEWWVVVIHKNPLSRKSMAPTNNVGHAGNLEGAQCQVFSKSFNNYDHVIFQD